LLRKEHLSVSKSETKC